MIDLSKIQSLGMRLLPVLVVGAIAFGVGAAFFSADGNGPEVANGQGETTEAKEDGFWSCSMCPQVKSSEPGQCPICGMDLIYVKPGEGGADLAPNQVQISDRAKELAKIRTYLVRQNDEPNVAIHLLGRIEPEESALRTVTSWIAGRIDRLRVNVTGQRVSKGQIIATLYSPEIFAAHQDLLVAKRQLDRLGGSSAAVQSGAGQALQSIRDRLALLGVSNGDVAAMEKAKQPWKQIHIRSPFSGTVLERFASQGSYIQTGGPLFKIADLSRVWVQLDAYENDLSMLGIGQKVAVEVEAFRDEIFNGKIDFIDPTLDRMRRTARVRVEVKNKDKRLRPGMFVQATVLGDHDKASDDRAILIPDSAPIFTGKRSVVYVEVPAKERPTYEARIVRLGPLSGDHYPVVAGLNSGERVVVNGAFVLDADLQIRGGMSMMSTPDDHQSGSWDQVVKLTKKQRKVLRPLFNAYLKLQESLADDDLDGAQLAASDLNRSVKPDKLRRPKIARGIFHPMAKELKEHASKLEKAENIDVARVDFENLSKQVEKVLMVFGNPLESPVRRAYCPMALDDRGATWVQLGEVIDNSYFGASMLKCGEIKATVDPGGYLAADPPADAEHKDKSQAMAEGHSHGGHNH